MGEVLLVAYALSFIISLSGVSALEANHRFLFRVTVGGSEVCCRLDTGLVYHIWSRGREACELGTGTHFTGLRVNQDSAFLLLWIRPPIRGRLL